MKSLRSTLLLFGLIAATAALVGSCQSTPGPTPTSVEPEPTPFPSPEPRAVVIAWQGARSDWIAQYEADGLLPNVSALASRGFRAEYLQPEEPVLTSTSFLVLSTGKYASNNGLESALTSSNGVEHVDALAQAEPFWRTAMRSGLRTAALFWPTASLDDPSSYADLMVVTRETGIASSQHVLVVSDAAEWQGAPPTYSPSREATLTLTSITGNPAMKLRVVALDTTDDGQITYDRLLVDDDMDPASGAVEVSLNQWATVTTSPRLHSSLRMLFTSSNGLTITLYTSKSVYSQARPDQLLQEINRDLGTPPPPADLYALNAGWISPEQYMAMALDRERWMDQVTLHVYASHAPELLVTARTLLADCARAFLLVDGRQAGYGPERAGTFSGYLKRAHVTLDDALGKLLTQVSLVDSSVFLVSPGGYLPVHTAVNVNTLLANARLLSLKTGAPPALDLSKTKAWAIAGEGLTHVFLNLEGREDSGIIAPEDYAKVQGQVITALGAAKDEANQPIFARIARSEDLLPSDLGTSDSGDIVAQAAAGYVLTDDLGVKKLETPATVTAAEGFASTLPEMRGVLLGAGGRLASGSSTRPVSLLDVAPTICWSIGVQDPGGLDGTVIQGIWH